MPMHLTGVDSTFSIDSIITAVGMTDYLAIMYIAVIVAITVMLVAADPLANFIEKNPTIVMLALSFLLLIGTTLIADGFGFHVPKGYIYAAMGFSVFVEMINLRLRKSKAPVHLHERYTEEPAGKPGPRSGH